jgi:glycosyltransferase involved in cell wall biosynthesis
VVVPNWNTGPLLRLCLASVLRFQDLPLELIVVDNGSHDASLATAEAAAVAGLIRLLRRTQAPDEAGAAAHGAALDLGLAEARAPYLFTLDSDAWAREPGWLGRFVVALEGSDASHAGATKFPPGAWQRLGAWLAGRESGPEARYVRPCHALYRTDLLRRHGLSFAPARDGDRPLTTGQAIHERLAALGYRPAILSHAEVARVVGHVRHATVVMNPDAFPGLRQRARRRGERALARLLEGPEAAGLLREAGFP